MRIVGLTGGVAMGKSTVTNMLRQQGYKVFDADACVRALYDGDQPFLRQLKNFFPDVYQDDILDKALLAQRVFSDASARQNLEQLIHPMVFHQLYRFIQQQRCARRTVIFCDVPLLFSHSWDALCDGVIVVYCRARTQQQRLKQRGWSIEKCQQVVALQMPITEQCRRADWLLNNQGSKAKTYRNLKQILRKINN